MTEVEEKKSEILNGVINAVSIGIEKGTLTWWVRIRHERGHQGFGGLPLRVIHIDSVLKLLKVDRWDDLVGRPLRVDYTHTKILGIGNFLENEWFYI